MKRGEPMIKTLDLQRRVTAILENAYSISYTKTNNQIWTASFVLPIDDPKVKKVQLLKYVEIIDEDEYIGLFRIIPKRTSKSSMAVSFECEHVLATLLGNTLFKDHQLMNLSTREVLQYLLDQQKVKHWRLGVVEIIRYFHYLWENENLASGIFSVPKPFDEPYRWTFDTTSYPWTLNLVRPNTEPVCRIKERHNLIDFEIEENPMSVYNRIYPLGYGEGVNQLTIESVNNGVPYIEDAESIAENEVIETVWVDKRFEDAVTLMASGKAILKKWKEPIVSWRVTAADVSRITGAKLDELKEGNVVRLELDDYPTIDLRIMKEQRPDIKGDPGNTQLEIGSLTEDLSTTQADLERRQQINEVYAQGATNVYCDSLEMNCDPQNPAVFKFFIYEDFRKINKMDLTFETTYFEGYIKAMESAGQIIESSTTESGGEVVQSRTTKSGGSVVQSRTTQSAGSIVQSKSYTSQFASPTFFLYTSPPVGVGTGTVPEYKDHTHAAEVTDDRLSHSHQVTVSLNIPGHDHPFEIQIPAHAHDFEINIPGHKHPFKINIPGHTHPLTYGIFKNSDLPDSIEIKVDGNVVNYESLSGDNLDLTPYLEKDDQGNISRNRWATIEITPNNLAKIRANLFVQMFIQSRGSKAL
jgi:phage minor structural protein